MNELHPANARDLRNAGKIPGKIPLEEGMATHSSIHAWGIPWTEEPRRLQSLGSHRVRHDWSDLARTHTPPSWVSFPPHNPTPLCHHRAPSWALCAIEQLPISYLFYTWQCIHVNTTLPVFPLPPMSTCLFSTSVSLFLPYKQVHLYYL